MKLHVPVVYQLTYGFISLQDTMSCEKGKIIQVSSILLKNRVLTEAVVWGPIKKFSVLPGKSLIAEMFGLTTFSIKSH